MRRFVPHDGPISAGRPDCVIRVKSQPGRTGKVEPPIGKDKNGVAHLFVAVLFRSLSERRFLGCESNHSGEIATA